MGTIKPDVNTAWANNAAPGDLVDPGSKYDTGWNTIGEKPFRQHMNYILNRSDTFEKHVNEYGVAQWDAITTYSLYSLALGSDGIVYQSLQNANTNNDPISSPAFWVKYSRGGYVFYGESTGTNNYAVTIQNAPLVFPGMLLLIKNGNTNTSTTVTLNLNTSSDVPVKLNDGTDPQIGDVIQDGISFFVYDGTVYRLLNPEKNLSDLAVGDIITTASPIINRTSERLLLCDGAELARAGLYAELFAIIGTNYGAGDGSTTFNIPDMRGYFGRGFDPTGAVDPGRVFGSFQDDAFKSHNHSLTIAEGGGLKAIAAQSKGTSTKTGSTQSRGGTETRPKNQTFNYYIKF